MNRVLCILLLTTTLPLFQGGGDAPAAGHPGATEGWSVLPGVSGTGALHFMTALHAQERTQAAPPTQQAFVLPGVRGWLGLELTSAPHPLAGEVGQGVIAGSGLTGRRSALRVQGVAADGPAGEADVLVGDLIVAIDGREATLAGLAQLLGSAVSGTPVELSIWRNGEIHRTTVVTEERPQTLTFRALDHEAVDSVRTRMVVVLDSLGTALRQARSEGPLQIRMDSARTAEGHLIRLPRAGQEGVSGQVRMALEGRVVREGVQGEGARPAALLRRDTLDAVRDVVALRGTLPGRSWEGWTDGQVLTEGRTPMTLAEHARWMETPGTAIWRGQSALPDQRVMLVAGMRVVGGAELTPLNPQLARYFGVEQGLLVLQVLEGTPAHDAGLEAGDVIIRVNEAPVHAVAEMRAEVARPRSAGAIPLRVVRDGREIELGFPRE